MPDDAAIREARVRAGSALRRLSHAFVGRDAASEQVDHIANTLEQLTKDLEQLEQRGRSEHDFVESKRADIPQGRFDSTSDDRPISGRSSPWGLDLQLFRYGDEIEALVTLGASHEGAPGRAHGGVVSALFDDVFGFVLSVTHEPAFTGDLYIRYAAPTPLFRQLACRVRLEQRDGRKLLMTGELTDAESQSVVATATGTFITVDPGMFARQASGQGSPVEHER